MKLLITGASGQLGSEIRALSVNYPVDTFVFVDREEMPLDQTGQIVEVLNQVRPDVLVNAGAYTAVDKAESEPDVVDAVNHRAVAVMANWVKENGKKIIQISTDYVFAGNSSTPLREDASTDPINVYGLSKLRGEHAVQKSGADAIIIRTAWVYSAYGANFVKTMTRLMNEREEIAVIDDQVGSPTYARDLAEVIMHIVHSDKWRKGIYHYSNEGQISWYDFAVAIRDIQGIRCTIRPVPTEQYPTPAKRPKYSLLDKSKIINTFGVEVPYWKDSLHKMLKQTMASEINS